MKRLLLSLYLCGFSACFHGCSPTATTEASYTGALLRCVDRSSTLAESRSCRALVDAQFNIDGGGR